MNRKIDGWEDEKGISGRFIALRRVIIRLDRNDEPERTFIMNDEYKATPIELDVERHRSALTSLCNVYNHK